MSEYIKREDVLQAIAGLLNVIEQIDSADVVDVRCKDCKWWTKQEDSLQGRCALMQSYPTGAWYCANGERKDNE